MAEEEKNIN